ncbi:MAG: hypothetical protein M5R36_03385 [Deltaproteobacteria bacterium]|nr:hypothetical protein [Deltaproteobacteria bacterium]
MPIATFHGGAAIGSQPHWRSSDRPINAIATAAGINMKTCTSKLPHSSFFRSVAKICGSVGSERGAAFAEAVVSKLIGSTSLRGGVDSSRNYPVRREMKSRNGARRL